MTTGVISDKGQVTIPSTIRRNKKLRPGTHVEFIERDDEVVIRAIPSLLELAGSLKPYVVGKTTDLREVREEALAEMAKEKVEKMVRENEDAKKR